MLQRFRKWQALPMAEQKVLLLMMLVMPVLELALRQFGFRRTRRWIEGWTARRVSLSDIKSDAICAERLAQLSAIAGNHGLIRATCLRQALLSYGILRWRGLDPELVIGVQRTCATPDMHAWVILDGLALGQSSLQHVPFTAPSHGVARASPPPGADRPSGNKAA